MLKDSINRKIEYLRISVTDKCNLRCFYCMPAEGVCFKRHDDILSYEEIVRLVGLMASVGVKKVRLTGGEPTVRRDLINLVGAIGEIPGIEEIAMTTNGLLLAGKLREYRDAGLTGINISLDSTDEEVYKRITGHFGAKAVLELLGEAKEAGLRVKLNCVPVKGVNDEGLVDIALLARDREMDVRFIELMPIGCGAEHRGIPSDELLSLFEERFGRGEPVRILPKGSAGPAQCYEFEGFKGRIGFISPLSHSFCEQCNRLRVTAEGYLKPCLFYEPELSLRDMMRGGATDEQLVHAIQEACFKKPEGHRFQTIIKPAGEGDLSEGTGQDSTAKEDSGYVSPEKESAGHISAAREVAGHISAAKEVAGHISAAKEVAGHTSTAKEGQKEAAKAAAMIEKRRMNEIGG